MKYFWTILLISITLCSLYGQADSTNLKPSKITRELSLNMTPLMVMLVPFNRSNPTITGPYMFQNTRYKGSKFFRFSLGANLNDIDNSGSDSYFNLLFGWGKRQHIGNRLSYLISGNFILSLGDLNILGTKGQDGAKIGVGPSWGIQYKISDKINIGTDVTLLMGINTEGFSTVLLEFIPPVSIFLNIEIPKKKKNKKRRAPRINDSDWYQ